MNKIALFAMSLLSLGLTGCVNVSNWNQVEGDGKIITETRNVSQFDRVSIWGSGHLTLVQGDEESLTIETDSNILALITTDVSNGRLGVGPHNVSLKPTKSIEYRLKVKNINELECSGAIHAESPQIQGKTFSLKASGASHVQVDKLEADKTTVDCSGASHFQSGNLKTADLGVEISGAARVELKGIALAQRAGVSGAGHYYAGDLKSERAKANASGAAHITLWVSENLDADASGASCIEYFGNPGGSHNHDSGAAHTRSLGNK